MYFMYSMYQWTTKYIKYMKSTPSEIHVPVHKTEVEK